MKMKMEKKKVSYATDNSRVDPANKNKLTPQP